MIGRADIEESKSDVAMDAWPPQASYPSGNFSDTSNFKQQSIVKGSLGQAFAAHIFTENIGQINYWPASQPEVSDLGVFIIVHLRYSLTNVPPQPNFPLKSVR